MRGKVTDLSLTMNLAGDFTKYTNEFRNYVILNTVKSFL
jgi:hypothetical protein